MRRTALAVATLAIAGATFLPIGGAGAAVTTTTIDFEVPIPQGGFIDANQYTSQGITITGAFGIVKGVSQGDPGNWGLEGTDGPQFLGQNNTAPINITFATPINGFQIDCSASNGTNPGNGINITGYNASDTIVDSKSATFPAVNTWTTFSLTGTGMVSVTLTGTPNSASPWGCDRMILASGTPDSTTTTAPTTTIEAPTTTTVPAAAEAVAVAVAPSFTG